MFIYIFWDGVGKVLYSDNPCLSRKCFPGNALESGMPEIGTLFLHALYVWEERREGRDTIQRASRIIESQIG